MAAEKNESAAPADLVLTRLLPASRAVVYRAWTDPVQLAQWWGPQGFSNPVCNVEARSGGRMDILMRGPDGSEYPMVATFRQLIELERIEFVSGLPSADGGMMFEVLHTVLLSEDGGQTRLRLEARVLSRTAAAEKHIGGMQQGWTESLDRCEAYSAVRAAATADTSDREMVISRLIDAPRDLVFAAWTKLEHLSVWWGPNGFRTTTEHFELKPRGSWRFVMHGPDGRDYQNQITFLEVVPPERLVYAHGGKDCEPVHFTQTITFTERGEKTLVTMCGVFPTAEERNRVAREYGAIEGGHQHLARLSAHLAAHRGGLAVTGGT